MKKNGCAIVLRRKINEQSNLPNTLLFTCSTNQGAKCFNFHDRLSLSRGDGLDFIFVLSNVIQNDSGNYEVVVEGTHSAISSLITIKKIFHLDINIGIGITLMQFYIYTCS